MFDFKVEPISDSIAVVEVAGDLNDSTQDYFFDYISDHLDDKGTPHLIIECAKIGFVSSAGMAAMLRARKSVKKRGSKIYFTHLNSTITTALEVTKLNGLLAIYPTTKELIAKLEKNSISDC